jgi:hypothetical protein
MPSSAMLRPVDLERTDVSEERIASISRVKIISELVTMIATAASCEELRNLAC